MAAPVWKTFWRELRRTRAEVARLQAEIGATERSVERVRARRGYYWESDLAFLQIDLEGKRARLADAEFRLSQIDV